MQQGDGDVCKHLGNHSGSCKGSKGPKAKQGPNVFRRTSQAWKPSPPSCDVQKKRTPPLEPALPIF